MSRLTRPLVLYSQYLHFRSWPLCCVFIWRFKVSSLTKILLHYLHENIFHAFLYVFPCWNCLCHYIHILYIGRKCLFILEPSLQIYSHSLHWMESPWCIILTCFFKAFTFFPMYVQELHRNKIFSFFDCCPPFIMLVEYIFFNEFSI